MQTTVHAYWTWALHSTSPVDTLHCLFLLLLLLLLLGLAGSGLATNIRDFFSLGKGAKANKRTEQDLKGFGQGQGAWLTD
jgi:hypothetical protein